MAEETSSQTIAREPVVVATVQWEDRERRRPVSPHHATPLASIAPASRSLPEGVDVTTAVRGGLWAFFSFNYAGADKPGCEVYLEKKGKDLFLFYNGGKGEIKNIYIWKIYLEEEIIITSLWCSFFTKRERVRDFFLKRVSKSFLRKARFPGCILFLLLYSEFRGSWKVKNLFLHSDTTQ